MHDTHVQDTQTLQSAGKKITQSETAQSYCHH